MDCSSRDRCVLLVSCQTCPYQGSHDATVPVRVWPRPQAPEEHQTPQLSPGSKCSSLGEWWPESAHCLLLKSKVTGDPKPSQSSPRQPSEWATLRMPSKQVCWSVHWLLQCGRLSCDVALFLGNGSWLGMFKEQFHWHSLIITR